MSAATLSLLGGVILWVGLIGYLVGIAVMVGVYRFLGRSRWTVPYILLGTLTGLFGALFVIFFVSLLPRFVHIGLPWRIAIAFITAGLLALAPWGVTATMGTWWWKLEHRGRRKKVAP